MSRARTAAPRRRMPRAEREAQVLDVAGEAFAECGYHEASMHDIALRVGVSKPVLYSHFDSKEALYLAYIRRAGRDLLERMVRPPAPGADPVERFRAGADAYFGFVEEQRAGWEVLYQQAALQVGSVAGEVAHMRARIARMIAVLLDECAAAHGAAAPPPERLDAWTHLIVGAGESLANWWILNPDVDRESVVAWYMAAVVPALRGLAPGEGSDGGGGGRKARRQRGTGARRSSSTTRVSRST